MLSYAASELLQIEDKYIHIESIHWNALLAKANKGKRAISVTMFANPLLDQHELSACASTQSTVRVLRRSSDEVAI